MNSIFLDAKVPTTWQEVKGIITTRAIQIILISTIAMLMCQITKIIIYSIRYKKGMWRMFISTGGFPSSHSGLCISLCVALGMFQYHDLDGQLDWSFAVACVVTMVIIHDAMGVRLEASKHAKILNNLADAQGLSEEEKLALGYGKKGHLKEMLGHKGIEVLGGVAIGALTAVVGVLICL